MSEAHPAFALLIAQLSPDEALILFRLKHGRYQVGGRVPQLVRHIPTYPEVTGNNFPTDELMFPENFMMYIEHLRTLNLTDIKTVKTGAPVQEGWDIENEIALSKGFGEMFARACGPDTIEPQWVSRQP